LATKKVQKKNGAASRDWPGMLFPLISKNEEGSDVFPRLLIPMSVSSGVLGAYYRGIRIKKKGKRKSGEFGNFITQTGG